jgi:hypothetical protein
MQDDIEEKAVEITYMDEIYSNCVLNIAATEADIEKGLIFDRNLLRINPCHILVASPATGEQQRFQVYDPRASIYPWEGNLNGRGWVFQERTLAPRVLHFTKDQVLWECSSLVASEVVPRGFYRTHVGLKGTSMGLAISENSAIHDVRTRWDKLVNFYSKAALSFIDDRLLAFSGIARRFAAVTHRDPTDYIAGMWTGEMPLSLLWEQYDQKTPSFVTKYAPSWSWAAVQAPIGYCGPPQYDGCAADVIDLQYEKRSSDPFDGTLFCRIRLCAPVCQVSRQIRDGKAWLRIGEETEMPEVHMVKKLDEKAISVRWDLSTPSVAARLEAENTAEVSSTYYFIFISQNAYRRQGLILRRVEEHATYVRVGRFLIMTTNPCPEISYVLYGQLHTLEEDDHLQIDSHGRYTLDII